MNSIGIMQGRLSPIERGKLQFFPDDWEAEFALARKMGFGHIQWFLDRSKPGIDPVYDFWAKSEILTKIDQVRSILPISSIDAGKYPLFGPERVQTLTDFKLLFPLVASRLVTKVISLPLLKETMPRTAIEKEETRQSIQILAEVALPLGLYLVLETELPAPELISLVDSFTLPNIGVTYDLGNCTAFGFNCPAEILQLRGRILEVHLKDCKINVASSVFLGTGDTDLSGCFKALAQIRYNGVYTLQSWRGDDYLKDAEGQLAFVQKLL